MAKFAGSIPASLMVLIVDVGSSKEVAVKFKIGDAVQIVDWDENVLTGEVVAVWPDNAFYCSDPTCCGYPSDSYDVLLQDGRVEEQVPEDYIHPRVRY